MAQPSRTWSLASRTLLQIVVVWSLALVVLPTLAFLAGEWWGLTSWRSSFSVIAGIAVLVVASGVGLWAAWVMVTDGQGTPLPLDAARHLVVTGPYHWVRNPMAVSGVAQCLGVALILGSSTAMVIPILGILLWQILIGPAEDRFLEESFGDDYRAYRESVSTWIPRR